MGLIFGGASASDLILNGKSVSLYEGGNPPIKVWPTRETLQITMGPGMEARDQFRAALTARGLDYTTVTELPFDIELVGSGDALHLFYGCSALISVPPLNTINVTNMNGMFQECHSLVTIPPLDTSNVVYAPAMFAYCSSLTSVPTMNAANMLNVTDMFTGCVALTDGNVLLTNRNPAVNSAGMIAGSGLTREPWYNADGTPLAPREVSIPREPYAASFVEPATGDTSLIGGWSAGTGERWVSFVAPVTCARSVRNADNFSTIDAGTVIPAGQRVLATYAQGSPYVFTEVL